MRDRLVTLLGALVALFLFVGLMFQPSGNRNAGKPSSVETGLQGYSALHTWLQSEKISVLSFRNRTTQLVRDKDISNRGNIFITTLPYTLPMRESEVDALRNWVAIGNTMLIFAALDDTPVWSSLTDNRGFLDDLQRLSGLTFSSLLDDNGKVIANGEVFKNTIISLVPVAEHPLMANIKHLQASTDSISWIWEVDTQNTYPLALRLAQDSFKGNAAMWQVPLGNGSIIVSGLSNLLSNQNIGKQNNRELVINLISRHMAYDGKIIFDDMHQGLSMLYDAEAFYKDPRVGISVLFILAFWILYLLGTNTRLVPVVEPALVPQQSDFVTAVSRFMSSKLSNRDTATLMFDNWFEEHDLEAASTLKKDPPWQELNNMPMLNSEALLHLQSLYTRMLANEKIDLTDLHNTIQQMRSLIR